MSDLVQCFERLIHPDWRLRREGNEWQLSEDQAGENQHDLLRIIGGRSLAFSLDKRGSDPWPFLKADHQPGIRKVSDAMVVMQTGDCACVIAIEMKTGDEGRALKQIHNARLFVDWLLNLLDFHRFWTGEWLFCGIVSFKPRRQERKGTTARTSLPKPENSVHGYPLFRLRNHPRLHLAELVGSLKGR